MLFPSLPPRFAEPGDPAPTDRRTWREWRRVRRRAAVPPSLALLLVVAILTLPLWWPRGPEHRTVVAGLGAVADGPADRSAGDPAGAAQPPSDEGVAAEGPGASSTRPGSTAEVGARERCLWFPLVSDGSYLPGPDTRHGPVTEPEIGTVYYLICRTGDLRTRSGLVLYGESELRNRPPTAGAATERGNHAEAEPADVDGSERHPDAADDDLAPAPDGPDAPDAPVPSESMPVPPATTGSVPPTSEPTEPPTPLAPSVSIPHGPPVPDHTVSHDPATPSPGRLYGRTAARGGR